MCIRNICSLAAVISTVALGTGAAAEDPDVIKLNELTCRAYLKMEGEERDLTALFLHGYISGAKAESAIVLSDLAEASDAIVESCIDKPDSGLLDTFKAKRP